MHDGLCSGSAPLRLELPLYRLGPPGVVTARRCSAWSGFVWQPERVKIWEVISGDHGTNLRNGTATTLSPVRLG